MNFDRISQWISVLANVGVLLGFVVVAYQLRITTDSIRAASMQASSGFTSNGEMALMGDTAAEAYAKSIVNPSELTYGELTQFWAYMSIAQISAMHSFLDHREGRISESEWAYAKEILVAFINYPMGRIWFQETKKSYAGSELNDFFSAIQEALDETPPNRLVEWFLGMHEKARALGKSSTPDAPREVGSSETHD